MHRSQIDEQVGQRIDVGNRRGIAEFRTLNAKRDGLTENAFDSGTLSINGFVFFRLTVELMANTSPRNGWYRQLAAPIRPLGM